MRKSVIALALEAIEFQDGRFFQDMTRIIEDLGALPRNLSEIGFWNSPELDAISRCIKAHTNLQIQCVEGELPAIEVPNIDGNHPLFPAELKEFVAEGYRYDGEQDIRKVMRTMEAKLVVGTVDLKRSKVGGIYKEIKMNMYFPRSMLDCSGPIHPAGVAAIILHEVGHAFTYMEYAGRAFTTNQILSGMVRVMESTEDTRTREIVFAKGANLLGMNKEQRDALLGVKSEAEITTIVMDAAVDSSRSELGVNIFDHVSSEALADQFAARHGAGRSHVQAMQEGAKYYYGHPDPTTLFQRLMVSLVLVITNIFLLAIFHVLYLTVMFLVLIWSPEYTIPEHNTVKGRYTRILNEYAHELKNRNLKPERKKQLLADYESLKAITDKLDDSLPLARKISYYLNPRYRMTRKFHVLQTDLELLASNDLFAKAAKLSTL